MLYYGTEARAIAFENRGNGTEITMRLELHVSSDYLYAREASGVVFRICVARVSCSAPG